MFRIILGESAARLRPPDHNLFRMEPHDAEELEELEHPVYLEGPSCPICVTPFTATDAKAKSATCDCTYHTACLVNKIHNTHWFFDSMCECGTLLIASHPYPGSVTGNSVTGPGSSATQIQAAKAMPSFAADAKAFRAKMRENAKALSTYKAKAKDAKAEFKTAIVPHVDAIRATRETMKTQLKESEEYKEFVKQRRATSTALAKFMKKYTLRSHHMDRLRLLPAGMGRRHRRWIERKILDPNYIFNMWDI